MKDYELRLTTLRMAVVMTVDEDAARRALDTLLEMGLRPKWWNVECERVFLLREKHDSK